MKRQRLSKRQWSGTVAPGDVSALVTEAQRALDAIPEQQIFVTSPLQYTEPMHLAISDERVPRIVSLARVVNADAPTSTVAYGAVCWEYAGGQGGQIKIIDIVSMSTGATRYQFTWKVEW